MKKALIGLAAIGAIVALRPVTARVGRKMSEHCAQMASKCRQMTGTHACAHETHEPGEHLQQEAPTFSGHRDAVTTA
jgi:hypothetical protein